MRQAVLGMPRTVSDLPDVLRVAQALQDTGVCLDGFAHPADTAAQADDTTTRLLTLLEELRKARLAATTEVSVSLAAVGVTADQARSNVKVIGAAAQVCGSLLTLDAADEVDATLAARAELDPSTGIVLRSGLPRTVGDCIELADTSTRVRLVRTGTGERHDDDLRFVRCLRLLMRGSAHVMVATADPRLLSLAADLARQCGRGHTDWEIHLPYGEKVRSQLKGQRIGADQRVRVDVTVGATTQQPSLLQRMARQLQLQW